MNKFYDNRKDSFKQFLGSLTTPPFNTIKLKALLKALFQTFPPLGCFCWVRPFSLQSTMSSGTDHTI